MMYIIIPYVGVLLHLIRELPLPDLMSFTDSVTSDKSWSTLTTLKIRNFVFTLDGWFTHTIISKLMKSLMKGKANVPFLPKVVFHFVVWQFSWILTSLIACHPPEVYRNTLKGTTVTSESSESRKNSWHNCQTKVKRTLISFVGR